MSNEKPILFSAPMVRAILAGKKTQTRRVVKPQPKTAGGWTTNNQGDLLLMTNLILKSGQKGLKCPYGKPGNRLWVREAFYCPQPEFENPDLCIYRATDTSVDAQQADEYSLWKPAIHMPRWACRLVLEVTDIRVQRLQDISQIDAIDEGFFTYADEYFIQKHYPLLYEQCKAIKPGEKPPIGPSPRECFSKLWDCLNATNGHGWDTNPWVWVVTFNKV